MTIRENMPGLARPVRIVDKSSRATDTAFSIFSSASKRASSIIFAAPSHRCALHRRRRGSCAPLLLIAALCIVAGGDHRVFPSGGDQRSDLLTSDRTLDIPIGQQVEHEDRHAIVHAQTECSGIGYLQPSVDDFGMG